MSAPARVRSRRRPPIQLLVGAGLVAVSWPLFWTVVTPYAQLLFFTLWLGYILAVDGLVCWRTGSSLLTRAPRQLAAMFLLSVPFWWLFEAFNLALQNWEYTAAARPGPVLWQVFASLCYATVLPALFETTELLAAFRPGGQSPRRPDSAGPSTSRFRIPLRRPAYGVIAVTGALCLVAVVAWPGVAYPLLWLGVPLLLDPINALRGRPSVLRQLAGGQWRPFWLLAASGLVCGLVWESWNVQAKTKWTYDTPWVDRFPHLFEMPLPGYLGYVPFAIGAYACWHAVRLALRAAPQSALRLDRPAGASPGVPGAA